MASSWQVAGTPRKWQEDALSAWTEEQRRGIAHVVTGAGKTRFAERCIAEFMNLHGDGHVVILVPTLALLDQWYVDLREDLDLDSARIGLFSGEQRTERRELNLVVLNTGREVAPQLSAGAPTFLIVDECHRAAAPMNSLALRGTHRATLGLSATPHREYDEGLEEFLVPALGEIFFTYDYDDAKRDGVISDFSLLNVAVPLTDAEASDYDSLSARVARAVRRYEAGDDSDDNRLRRLLRQRAAVAAGARMRVPVAVRIADSHRGRRVAIFHERIDAAEEIYALLSKRGHNVTLYHSRIGEAVRRDNLRLFRRGVFQVLVSRRALDEGMNVPETEVGIIASSTASTRQRIQRLGRVLRPAPGKDHALVYTLYATEVEEPAFVRRQNHSKQRPRSGGRSSRRRMPRLFVEGERYEAISSTRLSKSMSTRA